MDHKYELMAKQIKPEGRRRIIRTADIAKKIAEVTNKDEKVVNAVLIYGWRNICRMMDNGEAVRIIGLGKLIVELKKQEQ